MIDVIHFYDIVIGPGSGIHIQEFLFQRPVPQAIREFVVKRSVRDKIVYLVHRRKKKGKRYLTKSSCV